MPPVAWRTGLGADGKLVSAPAGGGLRLIAIMLPIMPQTRTRTSIAQARGTEPALAHNRIHSPIRDISDPP
jgi:hypothetical protein